jgi:hypothetical protein
MEQMEQMEKVLKYTSLQLATWLNSPHENIRWTIKEEIEKLNENYYGSFVKTNIVKNKDHYLLSIGGLILICASFNIESRVVLINQLKTIIESTSLFAVGDTKYVLFRKYIESQILIEHQKQKIKKLEEEIIMNKTDSVYQKLASSMLTEFKINDIGIHIEDTDNKLNEYILKEIINSGIKLTIGKNDNFEEKLKKMIKDNENI